MSAMDAGSAVGRSDVLPPGNAVVSRPVAHRPPIHVGLWAWMRERFPPSHAVLFVVLYFTASLSAQALVRTGTVRIRLADAASCVAAYAFFLMLRIFDEHKDYEADVVNHPDRALQRGWITLGHLRLIGAIAIATQAVVSISRDSGFGPITFWWLIAMGWSLLMAKEFFVSNSLRPRLMLYAATHMLVMPLIMMWLAQMGTYGLPLPGSIVWLALLSFASGFAFEVARKTKAPADERPGVDSYSQILGVSGAARLTSAFLAVSAAVGTVLAVLIAGGIVAWIAVGVQLAVAAAIIAQLTTFGQTPTTALARRCEKLVSVALLASHVTIIGAVIAERGVRW